MHFFYTIHNHAILSGLLILNVKPEALEIFYTVGALGFLNRKFFAPSMHPCSCDEFKNMSKEHFILKEMKIETLAFVLQNRLLK